MLFLESGGRYLEYEKDTYPHHSSARYLIFFKVFEDQYLALQYFMPWKRIAREIWACYIYIGGAVVEYLSLSSI